MGRIERIGVKIVSKTIKQIADELGLDKQRVYRFIVKNRITASSEVKQSKLYDEAAERLIKSHFSHITTSNERCDLPNQKSGQEQLFEQLIRELEIKNEQIKAKDRQIEQLLEQNTQISNALAAAQQTVAAAQALHAGAIKQLAAAPAAEEQPTTKTIWGRFWRK